MMFVLLLFKKTSSARPTPYAMQIQDLIGLLPSDSAASRLSHVVYVEFYRFV